MLLSFISYTHKRPLCGHCAPPLQKPSQSVCAFGLTSWGFMVNYTHKRPLCGHCAPPLQKPSQSVCAFGLTSWGFMVNYTHKTVLFSIMRYTTGYSAPIPAAELSTNSLPFYRHLAILNAEYLHDLERMVHHAANTPASPYDSHHSLQSRPSRKNFLQRKTNRHDGRHEEQ